VITIRYSELRIAQKKGLLKLPEFLMSGTPSAQSHARGKASLITALGLAAVLAGITLRCFAIRGELWLDELWSVLKVAELPNPFDIVTKVRHDNNHILNSVWIWLCGGTQPSFVYRIPAFIFSVGMLLALFQRKADNEPVALSAMLWLILVALSYPVTLYGTEARGYSLTMLCAVLAYLSLAKLLRDPSNLKAIVTFSACGIVGCLSHAIYVLFLAPAIAWLLWSLVTSRIERNSRTILWYGIVPPVVAASLLTFTFYRNLEIGGGPLLPYLEVAASTISVSFGGEALSSVNAQVTGWCLFLAVFVSVVCLIEVILWMRSGDPLASLVGLVLLTPWIAVAVIQPHFILPRYFIIQIIFAYLLAARFLDRLTRQGMLGALIAASLVVAFTGAHLRHTMNLAVFGRSNFVELFELIASRAPSSERTVGGDQDFQNGLRLAYAQKLAPSTATITYVSDYRTATASPHFVIRETLDAHEDFPDEWRSSRGVLYRQIRRYPAPQLNGAHVTLYEATQ
jgi:hypothetical protein